MDERIALKSGTSITNKYIIDEEIGRGGSCIVYNGHYVDDKFLTHKIRIKEFYPFQANITRIDTKIVFDNSEDFVIRKDHFVSSYERNVLFRNEDTFNNTSVDAREIVEDNGTMYIVLSMDGGHSLDHYSPKSLQECIEVTRALARAIEKYHTQGYLHLDIKPENILVLNDTKDMVHLFDFDSVTEIAQIKKGCARLSFSEGTSAPELISGSLSKIGPSTDIFSIGVLLFELLWSCKPGLREKKHCATFDFESIKYPINNYSKKSFSELETFFRRTMAISVGLRYRNMQDVIKQLDLLFDLFDEKRMYLVTNLPRYDEFFIGRDLEIAQIKDFLYADRRVFLCGDGGIGKSSLSICFAQKYENEFDEVLYLKYNGNWIDSIKENLGFQISNFEQDISETDYAYVLRKVRFFVDNASEKTLLIVDNLDKNDDESENKILKYLLQSKAKIIITSRLKNWESQNVIEVNPIKKDEDRYALFLHFCKKSEVDEYDIALMNRYYNNTIAIKLVAKQLVASRTSSKVILERVYEKGFSNVGKERVDLLRNGEQTKKSSFNHVREIFDISDLSEEERTVLFDISLLGNIGDAIEHIFYLCELDSYDALNDLIDKSWLNIDASDNVTMHPLILEVILESAKEHISQCLDFLNKFKMECFEEIDWEQIDYFELLKITTRIDSILSTISYVHLSDSKIGDCFTGLIPFLRKDKTDRSLKEVKYWELATENSELYRGKLDPQYIMCKIDIASSLLRSEQYEKAKEICNESLELMNKYSEIDSKWVECNLYGIVYNNLGSAYEHMGQRELAVAYYLKAIDNQQYSGDFYNYCLTACHLAEMYIDIWDQNNDDSRLVDAKDLISEVLSTIEWIKTDEAFNNEIFDSYRINTDLLQSRAYHTLGDIYIAEEELEDAIDAYDNAISCLEGYNGYREELSDRCYTIAHSIIWVKDPIYICSAKKYLEKAIKSIEYIGIEKKVIQYFRIISYLGTIAYIEKDFENAEKYYRNSIEVYEKYEINDELEYGKSFYNLANAEKMLGCVQNSMEHYREALLHLEKTDNYREALLHLEKTDNNQKLIEEIIDRLSGSIIEISEQNNEWMGKSQLVFDDFNIRFENDEWNFLVKYANGGWYEFALGDDFHTERNIGFESTLQDIIDAYGEGEYDSITDISDDPIYELLDECSSDDIIYLKKATQIINYYYKSGELISFYLDMEGKIVMIGFLS